MTGEKRTPGQERIIAAALELIRLDGFERFNMRKLSDALELTVGASYRHFGGKEKILEVVADRILSAIPFSDGGGDWRLAFADNARAYRAAFIRYPGVGAYLTVHLGETSVRQEAIKRSIGVLTGAGLSRREARQTAAVLNTFLQASAGGGNGVVKVKPGRPGAKSKPGDVPMLDEETFEFGLGLIISGIECQLAAKAPA